MLRLRVTFMCFYWIVMFFCCLQWNLLCFLFVVYGFDEKKGVFVLKMDFFVVFFYVV